MYYVYILKSCKASKTYVGCTTDIENRLVAHNTGKVVSSKAYRPYVLIHKEEFNILSQARKKELYYKTTSGRRKLKKIYKISSVSAK